MLVKSAERRSPEAMSGKGIEIFTKETLFFLAHRKMNDKSYVADFQCPISRNKEFTNKARTNFLEEKLQQKSTREMNTHSSLIK